jgi:hypothetical protein
MWKWSIAEPEYMIDLLAMQEVTWLRNSIIEKKDLQSILQL